MLNKFFAFDMDGTLIDHRGNLNEGVVEFFYKAINCYDEPRFLICTGNSISNTKIVISKINKALDEKYNYKKGIDFAISAFAGSVIIDKFGNVLKSSSINTSNFNAIWNGVKAIDKNAEILINTNDGLYFVMPRLFSVRDIKAKMLQLKLMISPQGFLKIKPLKIESYKEKVDASKVFSLEILSFDKDLRKKIYRSLSSVQDIKVTYGMTIQLSKGGKLDALSTIFGEDLSNVIYIGDDCNDLDSMSKCGLSFAFGNKVRVLKTANYAIKDFNDISAILFENANYDEISKKNIEEAEMLKNKKPLIKAVSKNQ